MISILSNSSKQEKRLKQINYSASYGAEFFIIYSPLIDFTSMNTVPGFAGADTDDIYSYVLSADSPLIGAGVEIDDGLTTDFFGNEITSNNIGCYGGNGVDVEYKGETKIEKLMRTIRNLFQTIIHEILNIFD